jgi:hypothetical protein
MVADNPCSISAQAVDIGLGDWGPLLNFRPPESVKSANVARFSGVVPGTAYGSKGYQPIEQGFGDCNMDMYMVDIIDPPASIDGVPFTAEALQAKIRQRFATLLDPNIAPFAPFESQDQALWTSGSPLGTVGRFRIAIHVDVDVPVDVRPDTLAPLWKHFDVDLPASRFNPMSPDACVVCAEYASDHWQFSTIQIPFLNVLFDGVHPVSGNRRFGLGMRKAGEAWSKAYHDRIPVRDKDTLFWYTRGVDRCSTLLYRASDTSVFDGGDRCWKAVQQNVANFLTDLGAHVEYSGLFVSERHSWDDVVANPKNKLWNNPPV